MEFHHFPIKDVSLAPDAEKAFTTEEIEDALRRHENGDWGDVNLVQRLRNELAIRLDANRWVTSDFESESGQTMRVSTKRYTTVTIRR